LGCGLITSACACRQLTKLNGAELDGRPIRVDWADKGATKRAPDGAKMERPERTERTFAPRAARKDDTGRRLYIGNLDYGTSDGATRPSTHTHINPGVTTVAISRLFQCMSAAQHFFAFLREVKLDDTTWLSILISYCAHGHTAVDLA
jgi:hypothetical protein